MKNKRTIKYLIEQKTANRKHARRRKRPLFRLEAKTRRMRLMRLVKTAVEVNKEN